MELLELNFNFLSAPVKGCARIDGTDFFLAFLPAPVKGYDRTDRTDFFFLPSYPHRLRTVVEQAPLSLMLQAFMVGLLLLN